MYGVGMVLASAMELDSWRTLTRGSGEFIYSLESVLDMIEAYLPKLTYPIRIGQHTDTAFALGQILDYAQQMNENRCMSWWRIEHGFYLEDLDYPVHYEPPVMIFSSCWNEVT